MDECQQLRKWLISLDDNDLGVLIRVSGIMRAEARLSPISADRAAQLVTRRDLLAARMWRAKATNSQLAAVAVNIVPYAARVLIGYHGFTREVVGDPDLEQLAKLLASLEYPISKLTLFGLLLGQAKASPVAREHRSVLEEALRTVRRTPVPWAAWLAHDKKSVNHSEDSNMSSDVDEQNLIDLETQFAGLRDMATSLASILRSTADQIEVGVLSVQPVVEPLAEFDDAHRRFAETLAKLVDVSPGDGFAEFETMLAQLRSGFLFRQEQNELETKIANLNDQVDQLRRLVASAPDVTKDHLRMALLAAESELRSLASMGSLPDDLADSEQGFAEQVTENADLPTDTANDTVAPEPAVPDQVVSPDTTVDVVPTTASPVQAAQGRTDAAPEEDSAENIGDTGDQTGPDLGHPWQEGAEPVAVALLAAGRIAEAYWVTAMSDESEQRAAVLRFASAAFGVFNNVDATAVLAALDVDGRELGTDPDAAAVATAAILRAGLVAGWAPSMLTLLVPELSLPGQWNSLVEKATDAIRHGLRVEGGAGGPILDEDADNARTELGRRAARLAEELPRRKNSYQRATQVMQRLLRDNQPLGLALDGVMAWSSGKDDGEALTAALPKLSGQAAIDTLIEEADASMRTPRQAREPIVASALRGLRRSIDEVRALAHEANSVSHRLTIARSAADVPARALAQITTDLHAVAPPPGMAGAAMSLLLGWLSSPNADSGPPPVDRTSSPTTGIPPVPVEPTTDVLLVLPDLPRTQSGMPDRNDATTRFCLARLVAPLDLPSAVAAYCARGDLVRARRTLELARTGYWGSDSGGPSAITRMQQTITSAAENWQRQYRADVVATGDLFARIRIQNLLDQSDETGVSGRLQALSTVPDEAYDIASRKLADLTSELRSRLLSRIAELRAELSPLDVDYADRNRILPLLDDGDTVTAAEFLAFVRAGTALPEDHAPVERDLTDFVTLLRAGLPGNRRSSALEWAKKAANGTGLLSVADAGLRAWESLADAAGRGDRMPGAVRDILRTLGLTCSKSPREIGPRRRESRQFLVPAAPNDQSYVAAFGSAATEYTVTVALAEERRGWSVSDLLKVGPAGRANILLHLHPIDLGGRRQLAEQAAGTPVQALVIDPAVMGWISATAPGSWRATQRVTLPWTGLNPYTPFVAGLVPPEVFVGRDREISAVTDPAGGLFVYGGRQLGKSALLRKVQATFDDGAANHAVYLDLKGRGIGEAEPAVRIWRELAIELHAHGVMSARATEGATADTVVSQVRTWLNNNSGRRILFLADEADAFLTADSRGVATAGGVANFPNVLRLKELMEYTERRFKVVFAGLHQVQRFGHLSNVPLVHGGPDILVGPLAPRDAQRLVMEPLMALGYTFERPELVWRLLSATNYQASLIQIFCEELATTLLRRRVKASAWPVLIAESDVDAVAASDRVRRRITERLRITINLEDRYRVLTLVIALHSLNDSFGVAYTPEELLQLAREHWPAGFKGQTIDQVSIYLDEMVGLGLLIRLSGQRRYAVRSPNVVNMLGTKMDLERELSETVFDLPYEYNPRDARRLLSTADGVERRSPLTDGQLSQIVKDGILSVVTGTKALGIDRVSDSVRDYAEMRGSRVIVHDSATELVKAIAAASRDSRSTVAIADCRTKPANAVTSIARQLSERQQDPNVSSSVVVLVDSAEAILIADEVGVEVVRLARWTTESLRSWPECPFDVPQARTQLIEATGGWPELVENTIARVLTRGTTQAQAVEQVRASCDDPAWAEAMLRLVELPAALTTSILEWVHYGREPVTPADLAEVVMEVDLPDATRLLEALDIRGVLDVSDEGVALDRVVARCLQAIRTRS
jgi:hypothetical protein